MNRERLHLTLRARSEIVYDSAYHHKLRGCIWSLLSGTEYENEHDQDRPLGITFTNPAPWGDAKEGDEKTITISATREPLLAEIAKSALEDPMFNIGEMPFEVVELTQSTADVGEPGSKGVIETRTGVHTSFGQKEAHEYDITPNGNSEHYWRPSDPLSAFIEKTENNLQTKYELLDIDSRYGGPEMLDGPIFDTHELIKTFWTPLTLTQGVTHTTCLSKWRLGYTVRSEAHRELLNMALAAGIGERNGLGLGAVEIAEQATPGEIASDKAAITR